MITLIGEDLAEKGLEFIYYGAAPLCESCRFKNTCIESLEEGRRYVITDVKNTEHPCLVHEGGKVKVVEVEKAEIETLFDTKRAFEGSMVVFDSPDCDEECTMRDLCFPEGIYKNEKCKIVKNIGKPDKKCVKGLDLSLVVFEC